MDDTELFWCWSNRWEIEKCHFVGSPLLQLFIQSELLKSNPSKTRLSLAGNDKIKHIIQITWRSYSKTIFKECWGHSFHFKVHLNFPGNCMHYKDWFIPACLTWRGLFYAHEVQSFDCNQIRTKGIKSPRDSKSKKCRQRQFYHILTPAEIHQNLRLKERERASLQIKYHKSWLKHSLGIKDFFISSRLNSLLD